MMYTGQPLFLHMYYQPCRCQMIEPLAQQCMQTYNTALLQHHLCASYNSSNSYSIWCRQPTCFQMSHRLHAIASSLSAVGFLHVTQGFFTVSHSLLSGAPPLNTEASPQLSIQWSWSDLFSLRILSCCRCYLIQYKDLWHLHYLYLSRISKLWYAGWRKQYQRIISRILQHT